MSKVLLPAALGCLLVSCSDFQPDGPLKTVYGGHADDSPPKSGAVDFTQTLPPPPLEPPLLRWKMPID